MFDVVSEEVDAFNKKNANEIATLISINEMLYNADYI
jgi:hypothetical protein